MKNKQPKNIREIRQAVLKLSEAIGILREWSEAVDLYYLKPSEKIYLSDLRLTLDNIQDKLKELM